MIFQEELMSMKERDWEEMTEEVFKEQFKESPLLRTGLKNMKRNIQFISPRGEKSEE